MNRRRKDIIILVVLVPVLLIVLFSGWHKKGKKPSALDESDTVSAVEGNSSQTEVPFERRLDEILVEQKAREKEYLENGFPRNPFAQFAEENKTSVKTVVLNVSGIFHNGDDNLDNSAFVNGKILSRGQNYQGLIVEQIGENEVTFRSGENTYTVKVGVPIKINIP